VLGAITPTLVNTAAGVLAGIIALVAVKLVTRMLPRKASA
jgi:biopolymer transport protein ExbB/TolQ